MLIMQNEDTIKERIVEKIENIAQNSEKNVLVAIDGRCCSGKTTFAGYLSEVLDCNVFHMDDYFLRPGQRTTDRLNETGGNVDRERFIDEVLKPLIEGTCDIEYRKFDCHTMSLQSPIRVSSKKINIIEGVYCCHPDMIDEYDLKIFLDIPKELQKERILKRNGTKQWEAFRDRWLPMEEKYFEGFDVREKCDISMCLGK